MLNAGSGRKDADASQRTISEVLTAGGREHRLLVLKHPDQIHKLAAQAVTLARERGGVVAAAGGDGTLNAVAQAVLDSGCAFGVIPQGTFNYFSRTHGIPLDTAESARALLTGTIKPVQVGLANGRLFLVNASLGLYPELLEDRDCLLYTSPSPRD